MRLALIGYVAIFFMVLIGNHAHADDLRGDGYHYTHASQTLIHDGEFRNVDNAPPYLQQMVPSGSPFTLWPPAWPMLLAAGQAVGIGAPLWTAVLNALSFAIIAFCLWVILSWMNAAPWLYGVVPAVILTEPFMWGSIHKALVEPPFIALLLVFFIVLVSYPKHLFIVTALGATVALTKYTGALIIPVGCLYYLVFHRNLIQAFFFGLGSSAPLMAWLLRNYAYTGTLMGPRLPGDLSQEKVINDYTLVLSNWIEHAVPIILTGFIAFTVYRILSGYIRHPVRADHHPQQSRNRVY